MVACEAKTSRFEVNARYVVGGCACAKVFNVCASTPKNAIELSKAKLRGSVKDLESIDTVTADKLYPLSIDKHQHNVDFAITSVKNQEQVAIERGQFDLADRLAKRADALSDLWPYVMGGGGVVWVPGWVIAKVKEISLWADETRAENQLARR